MNDNTSPRRVLVTGANGFVGRALVAALLAEGATVVAAQRRGVGALNDASSHASGQAMVVETGDIDGKTDWSTALHGVDTVVHLAARVHVMNETAVNPLDAFRRVNVEGTRNLALQARAAGARRFVFVSSVKVNGESGAFTETDVPNPSDPYGVSKHEAEGVLHGIARDTGLEVVIIRPPLVYGPGVKANFLALIRLVQRGIPLPFGAIHNRRSFVAVDNLVSLISRCTTHPGAVGETFLVSDGHDMSTTDLLRAIGTAAGKTVVLVPVPSTLLRVALAAVGKRSMADRLLDSLTVDIRNAHRKLDWSPPVSVAQALRNTIQAASART